MLAGSPFYTSGTFWGAAAAVLALVAIVLTVVLWRLGGPKRLLTYSMPVASTLLSRYYRSRFPQGEIQVMHDGQLMTDPHVVVLRMDNRSRRDIRASDFDQDRPIEFDFGANIVVVGDPGNATDAPPDTLRADRTKIFFGPTLIRGGAGLRLTLITEGSPRLAYHNPLVDVNIKEQGAGSLPVRDVIRLLAAAVSAICFSLGLVALLGANKVTPNVAAGVVLIVLSMLILGAVFILTKRRPRRRQSK